jgi:hypothetical protein
MAQETDIVEWLRQRRDEAAANRNKLFTEVARRGDAVKSGSMTVEEAARLNASDTLEANTQDALCMFYFRAWDEVLRSRKIIADMTASLRNRSHYTPDEVAGR